MKWISTDPIQNLAMQYPMADTVIFMGSVLLSIFLVKKYLGG